MKALKSLESDGVTICAKAAPVHQSAIQLISKHTEDWEVVNVKTSCTDDIQDGEKSTQITITFVADTSDQSETTSSTKS